MRNAALYARRRLAQPAASHGGLRLAMVLNQVFTEK
jgi:hypothetical protein